MKKTELVVLLLMTAFVCSRCARPLSPKYLGYQNFRLERAGLQNNMLAADVRLYNPNRYPLQIKSASIDVYFNNAYLGHSSFDSLIVLPAKDTADVPVQLQAKAKDVLSNAFKVLLDPDIKIKITGSVKAGRGGFFLNVPVDYEGVQRIKL